MLDREETIRVHSTCIYTHPKLSVPPVLLSTSPLYNRGQDRNKAVCTKVEYNVNHKVSDMIIISYPMFIYYGDSQVNVQFLFSVSKLLFDKLQRTYPARNNGLINVLKNILQWDTFLGLQRLNTLNKCRPTLCSGIDIYRLFTFLSLLILGLLILGLQAIGLLNY